MNSKKNLKRNLLICLLAGSAVMYTLPLHAATSVIGNGTLPSGGEVMAGQIDIPDWARPGGTNPAGNLEMNIIQNSHNGVIKWDSFDIGGSATVNFRGPQDFNTLNYVNSGAASQIYGTINANNNGNIFIVNPAGVQIGNSAQINVGSLYVSNKYLNENEFSNFNGSNINNLIDFSKTANAELMSLGNINAATNVTFDGDRIVLDTDRIIFENTDTTTEPTLNIRTTDSDNIVLGYEAYNEQNGYADTINNEKTFKITEMTIDNSDPADIAFSKVEKSIKGYMWVEDVNQLQAINTNLSGNYALRNSIDATATSSWNNNDGFKQIGTEINNAFTGKFDGLDYNIFGLTINRSTEDNVGLFGVVNGATINNVTLVGGSITGDSYVGGIVGNAIGENTVISNATNSASVTGNSQVGGIVGIITGNSVNKSKVNNVINTGTINGNAGNDVGGLIGSLNNSQLIGNSYNLGAVTSSGHDVGGLVGSALNSTIGDGTNLVYNRLDVTGAYNVGGIVGNMEGSTVKNAENSGTVLATWYSVDNYGNSNGKYNYHSAEYNSVRSENVNVANVGGIVGISSNSTITNVENSGDVSTETIGETGDDINIYRAGNVGGVVGSAVDTNITNATNKENSVRGAHNVGGIAGYFSGTGTINKGINDGGNIMATGARYGGNFVRETVRPITGDANESFIIGNIGGIVGYMEGNGAKVTGSANRGTVHTDEPGDPTNVEEWQKAANVGGVVGKIDRSKTDNLKDEDGKIDVTKAAVSNSYNTGDVLGYTGVGGVAGMMYNGEIAASYNLGYLRTTRQSQQGSSIDALNMGGIVGDTTELSGAKVYLYDVYNKGQIGDSEFNYFGRHVGGIVGRLSGTVEKAYNNGAIYNGYNVVGGIAGWMAQGKIENAFNTGNITVLNKNNASSQVGGIAGAASDNSAIEINNAYNLGTLRSFKDSNVANAGNNTLGGILGHIQDEKQGNASVTITNVYTTGNLFIDEGNGIGSIYGSNTIGNRLNVSNAYYIRPQEGLGFTDLYDTNDPENDRDNSNKAICFAQKSDLKQYHYYDNDGTHHSLTFTQQEGGKIYGSVEGITTEDGKLQQIKSTDTDTGAWRIYGGNTPILNAFLPKAEDYFSGESGNSNAMNGIDSIQYGTAYDPLLTIIKADDEYLTANNLTALTYDWSALGISNAAGLVVYGAGLTLDKVNTSGGSGYFGGTIYADGALNLNGGKNDIGLGSAADIYGSAVNITTDGKVTIYGDVTATGNTANGAASDTLDEIKVDGAGNININAGDVDVYGTLTSAERGSSVVVSGIEDQAVQGWKPGLDIGDEEDVMSDIADRFAHTTGASDVDGNITIIAKTKLVVDDNDNPILDENGNKQYIGGGNVNLYYGNKEQGLITTGGNLTVTGTGDVYVDSDLSIGGGLSLTAGADKEIVLDISNIGQVQNNHDNTKAVKTLHDFLDQFSGNNAIKFNGTDDAKITVDMWQGDAFDLDKFDIDSNNTFAGALTDLKVKVNGADTSSGRDITHIWVSSGEQLKNIQTYYNEHINDTGILGYNFALKNDINASDVSGYEAIGTNSANGFTGTFDGRGNRIIGLTVENANGNAGIFDAIGTNGVVKDVNIYSGTFTGSDNAGAVAGENNGRIEGIVTFGNTVTSKGNTLTSKGNAGGIVGVNNSGNFSKNETTGSTNDGVLTGGIYDVESTGSVIAGSSSAVAGGLVGTNNGGLANSFSDSAVTVATGVTLAKDTTALGGVVGINNGNVQYVDSLGVTNGGATNSSNIGGIIGINNDNMYSGYNESIVSGKDNVGGIIGENNIDAEVSNIVNATRVTGEDKTPTQDDDDISKYVGGLVGTNSGSVTNGRNNGTITGNEYVGGLVGSNAQGATLTNLVNDSSAAITGEQYVGGIAGSNAGMITTGKADADDEKVNLINRGSITGYENVGGVAGTNSGTIENANNDIELNVNTDAGNDAKYFGGIAGVNTGTITNATNQANVNADGAAYVGGIVGKNDGTLKDMAGNSGNVTGKDYVGGVAGLNTNNQPLDGVEASNTGTVFATNGGAGGIFAVNNANITNSKLTNNGAVIGNSGNGTGGIFGVNTGNISTSSLINEVDGQVVGTNNVGGLIGKNTGTIIGGRDDADSYYKYKIYNNGVINVGTWTDSDGDGVVDVNTNEFTAKAGQNIGGLIGNNAKEIVNGVEQTGSLTAGYNTGAINASGSTNVGGIAGSNSGTIDQVFNTIMVADGTLDLNGKTQSVAVNGGINVGGLVGNNSGILNNAYNTTSEVKGNAASTGNLVGTNSGTVQYVYGVADKLIGDGKTAENGYVIDTSDQWKQEGSYAGFTFEANGWKIYNGYSNPMLSVFLTKVTVVDQHLVNQYFSAKHYGELHQITADDIKALIAIGAISAPDGFGAFNNNNGLIQGVADDAMANSGNWLYSQQILGSNINGLFNPNNLGYDISLVYSPFELDNDLSSHWNYLFNDAPFDRNKDFRERKAEVNFVDGGMEI